VFPERYEGEGRICRIFIRDVTGETAADPRYQTAFHGLPAEVGCVFRDADQVRRVAFP